METLSCESNKLASLSVEGCDKLGAINCHLNQIKESQMSTLVNSLRTIPAGSQGTLRVIAADYSAEGNQITDEQVTVARKKNWLPYSLYNGNWVELEGAGLTGDVDGNGVVNGSDVTALYNYLLNNVTPAGNADVDGNNTINGSDVTALYNLLLK